MALLRADMLTNIQYIILIILINMINQQALISQFCDVKSGGWSIFILKIQSAIKKFLLTIAFVMAIPFIVLIVAIRPIVHLRFGRLSGERFGHFSSDVETYICNRETEVSGTRVIDIIGSPEIVCNNQLYKMWNRAFKISPGGSFWSFVDRACQILTRGENHHIKIHDRAHQIGLLLERKQQVCFTDEEHQEGQRLKSQLGLPEEASWVCIHNRDPSFLEETLPGIDFHYHDYRDFSIQPMIAAAEELTKRGYYVLRMGSVVTEALNVNNPMIIDYSSHPLRSDFADIYLLAGCEFYFGSDSGIFSIPAMFRKPFAFINFPSLQAIFKCYYSNLSPFIIKRLWHNEKKHFLTLREIYESGLADAAHTHIYDNAGVTLIDNTSDEILDLAIEVDDRLKGHWQPQGDDDILQKQFWDILRHFSPHNSDKIITARIGAAFLRKHSDLLD
jgi:putative glycosyltransferase (TIGR04372 family)